MEHVETALEANITIINAASTNHRQKPKLRPFHNFFKILDNSP
jgi:hypothetical protein